MRYLTLEWIKSHSRIDYDIEDELLTLYGDAAEEAVLNIIGRSYRNLVLNFGSPDDYVPAAIKQATLMLVDASYTQRSPVSSVNMFAVPYTFDFLVKPYMKLANGSSSSGVGSMVTGYYNSADGLFYRDAGFTEAIVGDLKSLYRDIPSGLVYVYNGEIFVLLNADMFAVSEDEMDDILDGQEIED